MKEEVEKKKKVKIRSKTVLSKIDEILLENIKEHYDSLTDLPTEQKREFQHFLSQLGLEVFKNLKSNVQVMTQTELSLSAPNAVLEPVDNELNEKVDALAQQVSAVAKRIKIFRKLYPKEINDELQKHENYVKAIEDLKESLEAPPQVEEKPNVDHSVEMEESFDTFSRVLSEAQDLVVAIPVTNDKLNDFSQALEIKANNPIPTSTTNTSLETELKDDLPTPTPEKKKRGRPLGWRKADKKITPTKVTPKKEVEDEQIPVEEPKKIEKKVDEKVVEVEMKPPPPKLSTTPTPEKKKRGRPLGWRKGDPYTPKKIVEEKPVEKQEDKMEEESQENQQDFTEESPNSETSSPTTPQSEVKKRGRKKGWKKDMSQESSQDSPKSQNSKNSLDTSQDLTPSKIPVQTPTPKKRGRPVGWKKGEPYTPKTETKKVEEVTIEEESPKSKKQKTTKSSP
eukprot:gene5108-8706_t